MWGYRKHLAYPRFPQLAALDVNETGRNLNEEISWGLQCGFLVAMPTSDRRDRGALRALGMILAAIVVIAAITAFEKPTGQQASGAGDGGTRQSDQAKAGSPVTSRDDFNPWQAGYDQWLAAFAAAASVGVSIAALVWLRKTWKETETTAIQSVHANRISNRALRLAEQAQWEARRVNEESLRLARASNRIARRSAEQQLRAYLSSPEITGTDVAIGKTPKIRIKIKNTGQTPAYLIRARGYVRASTANPETFKIIVADSEEGDITEGEYPLEASTRHLMAGMRRLITMRSTIGIPMI